MRQRAALISILLLGAVGAIWAAPVAAQVPEPPPPPDIPKPDKPEKPPKPEKPDPPGPPEDPDEPPEVPEPPSTPTEPEPPTEPAPPTDPPPDEEPSDDDGSTGPGRGSSGGRPGTQPGTSEPGDRSGASTANGVRVAAALAGVGSQVRRGLGHRSDPTAPASGEGVMWVDRVVGNVLGSLDADASSSRRAAAVGDSGSGGTGGLPLAGLAAGLVLVSIGLAAGAARARGASQWHPPGARPDRT
jgi:hypothetical protein